MHIRFHKFLLTYLGTPTLIESYIKLLERDAHLHEIDLGECLQAGRPENVQDGDNVLVVEMFEDLDLSQRP